MDNIIKINKKVLLEILHINYPASIQIQKKNIIIKPYPYKVRETE